VRGNAERGTRFFELRAAQGKLQLRGCLNEAFKGEETRLLRQMDERKKRLEQTPPGGGPTGRCHSKTALFTILVVTDRDARIPAQLISDLPIAVPRHFLLVDSQKIAMRCNCDDVPLPGLLFEMRPRDRYVLVIGVIRLRFLFDNWPASDGRAESQRPDCCTHY
jgi:hypothetical protein